MLKKCAACYDKAKAELLNNSRTICSICLVNESSMWYKDPKDPTRKKCAACYNKRRAELLNKSGIICSICLVNESSTWYKDPKDPTRKKCAACYGKLRRLRKNLKRGVNDSTPNLSNTQSNQGATKSIMVDKNWTEKKRKISKV